MIALPPLRGRSGSRERRSACRCDDAHGLALGGHGRTVSSDVAWLHLQADELAPGSVSLHFLEHVAADEVALAELDRPTKPRLVWVDRFVHIVSPQTKCRLESGRVASTEACRKYTRLLAAREDGVPHVAHPVAVDEQLESVLARVTRPRDQGMD